MMARGQAHISNAGRIRMRVGFRRPNVAGKKDWPTSMHGLFCSANRQEHAPETGGLWMTSVAFARSPTTLPRSCSAHRTFTNDLLHETTACVLVHHCLLLNCRQDSEGTSNYGGRRFNRCRARRKRWLQPVCNAHQRRVGPVS